jgi:hypothetical protein
MATLPHFIGIGAQKAGTSWLHASLKRHPEIWVPPAKEIHYFDRNPSYPSPSVLYPDNPISRLLGSGYWSREYRKRVTRAIRNHWRSGTALRWYLRYYLMPVNERWYASLFREGRDRIRGEFTPAYAMLEPLDIMKVRRMMPDLKIVYTLRNPVERAWSHFRMLVKGGELRADISLERFREWVDSPEQALRGSYRKTIENWSNAFGRERVYVGFYDDIIASPEKYLQEVLSFIGAANDASTIARITVKRRINASPRVEIPPEFEEYLFRKYEDEIALLAEEFEVPVANWHATLAQKQPKIANFPRITAGGGRD